MDENKFDESMYLSVISIANDCETFYDFIEHITELVKAGILAECEVIDYMQYALCLKWR